MKQASGLAKAILRKKWILMACLVVLVLVIFLVIMFMFRMFMFRTSMAMMPFGRF
jgi:hypothetical protein